jgi:hypothetical protein
MAFASVRSGCEVTTVCLEEGAAVELLVESTVCVFEATGDRLDFLNKSGGGGPDSLVFFFLRRPPNVGMAARRRGGYERRFSSERWRELRTFPFWRNAGRWKLDSSLLSMRLFGDLCLVLVTLSRLLGAYLTVFRGGYWVHNIRSVAPSPVAHRVDEIRCGDACSVVTGSDIAISVLGIKKDAVSSRVTGVSRMECRLREVGMKRSLVVRGEADGGASSRVQVGTRRIVP